MPRCAIIKLPGSAPGTHWLTARLDGLSRQVKEVAEDSIASRRCTLQDMESPHSKKNPC